MPWPGARRAWGSGLPLVLLAGVLLHVPTLGGYFLGDDFAFVRLYRTLPPRVFGSLFLGDWSQGIWHEPGRELRPLLALSYRLDFALWGANATGYRLTNLAWLLLSLWGLHRLVASLETEQTPRAGAVATVATLLFSVHPVLPGAVDWIAGRSDLLAAAAVFWSLHWMWRHLETGRAAPALLGLAGFTLGLFAKENVVVVALLLPALVAAEASRGRWVPSRAAAVLVPAGVVSLAWVTIRLWAFGSVGGPVGALRSGEARWGYYAEQLLRLPRPAATAASAFGLGLALVLALRSGRARGASWAFWGVLWPLITLAPAMAATYESPRHVLLAVVGPAVVLAKASVGGWSRAPRARWVTAPAVAVIVMALGTGSVRIVEQYAQMGRASHELRRLLAAAPPTAVAQTVVVSAPRSDEAVFWDLTLPFAAEPPFLDRPLDVLSGPDLYCCRDWVEASRPAFVRLSAVERAPVYRIEWEPGARRFAASVVASPFPPRTPPPATFAAAAEWIDRVAAVPRGPGG